MSQDLIKRADELRSRFKVLESVKNSGYHDEDRDHVRTDRHIAPQKNGFPPASQHLVMFTDYIEENVHFAGRDAEKVMACLKEWESENKGLDFFSATGTDKKLIIRIIPRLKVVDGVLTIRLSEWNDVLSVLVAKKVGLQGRAYIDDGSPMPGE